MASIKLYYFPFPGRAGAIRDALHIGKVAFEDNHVQMAEFQAAKPDVTKYPLGTLPYAVIDGVTLNQSNAILRYVGRRANLYSDDLLKAAKIDEALDMAEDFYARLAPSFREQDEQKRLALRKDLVENVFPRMLAGANHLVEKNGNTGFWVGNSLSVADLKMFYVFDSLTSGRLDGVPKTVVDPYTALVAWHKSVTAAIAKAKEHK